MSAQIIRDCKIKIKKGGGTYGLEVAVFDSYRMQILQSARRFCELQQISGCGLRDNGDQAYEAKTVHLGVL